MMASASAAALAALAVTVAVPAFGDDDNPETAKPGVQVAGPGPGFTELGVCLRAHGLEGAPHDINLKPWLGERLRRGDQAAERALEACGPEEPPDVKRGPSPEELRACLKEHGVDVPGGNGLALKRWFIEQSGEARYADELKACGMAPPPDGEPVVAIACDAKGERVATAKAFRAPPAGRPKPVTPADPAD